MFQFATGFAIANRLGVNLHLDVCAFDHYDLRRYELDDWKIGARIATAQELVNLGVGSLPPTRLQHFIRSLGLGRQMNSFKETSFSYDPSILNVTDPIYIEGYWQSDHYFCDATELLRKEFTLKASLDVGNQAMATKIVEAGSRAVSLHIRRGDYVSNQQTAQYHGVCSLDYYHAAVAHIAEREINLHFFVFSDDLAWVRDNLELNHPITLVDVNGPDKGAWDMSLMMACRHHIIANSSFSWWGAWLNPHDDKIVVAPQRWFSGENHDTSDLIPSSWVRL